MTVRTSLLRLCAAALLLLALSVAAASEAGAHALLRTSSPTADAVLEQAPDEVVLVFSETPEPGLSEVRVIDASGRDRTSGSASAVPDDPLRLRVALHDLEDGVYAVSWRAYSTVDGHVTAGVFAFGVGVPVEGAVLPDTTESVSPPPSPAEVSGRWLLYAGLGLLMGVCWVGAPALGRPRPPVGGAFAMGWVMAAAGLLLLGWAQWSTAGVELGRFLATPIGRALGHRTAGVASVGALGLVALGGGRWRPRFLVVAGGLVAATMLAHVSAGHAAAGPRVWLTLGSQWAHFLAGGLWIGGLAALLVGIRGEPDARKATAVRRYSTAAGGALALVVVTGVLRAAAEVGSLPALWATGYGRLVAAKIVLLVALVALGARNRWREVPRASETLSGLHRVGRAEVLLGVGVLAATAMLTSLTPPRGDVPRPATGPVEVAGSDFATTVRVRLAVDPGTSGLNTFRVDVVDYDTERPVDARRVALRFEPPDGSEVARSTLELRPGVTGTWEGRGANLAADGTWTLVVVVESSDRAVEVPLDVTTRCRTQTVTAPGQPSIHTMDLGGGRSVQGYVDPGQAGYNEVHFTFFDDEGREMAVTGVVSIGVTPEGGQRLGAEVRQFSPGHFVGSVEMARRGTWRLDVAASTPQGERLNGCFEEVL